MRVVRQHHSRWTRGMLGLDGMHRTLRERDPDRAHVLQQVRSVCTRLPHAEEIDEGNVGDPEPLYKVGGRIFAMQHVVDERMSLWCKAAPGTQDALVTSDPEHFFAPPYVGQRGWVGIWLDISLDWDEIGGLIEDSYRRTAPARLISLLTDSGEATSGPIGRERPVDARATIPYASGSDHVEHSA